MSSRNSDRKRLFLIDGYAMLYRCHFALIRNPLITSYGLHTSALYGFTNQILKLIEAESPDYIGAIFDTKEKTLFTEILNEIQVRQNYAKAKRSFTEYRQNVHHLKKSLAHLT